MREPEIDLATTDVSDLIAGAGPDVLPAVSATRRVGMSLKLAPSVMHELLDRAGERGIGHTTLAAELIEAGLAGMRDRTMVPLADVQRAIARLADPAA